MNISNNNQLTTYNLPLQPKDSLLDFPDKLSKRMDRFVAMPSESMWAQGYKPAWMLSDTRDPPEKYTDAQYMYRIYLKTGKVVYPKRSHNVDSTNAAATVYMKKYTNTKKAKKVAK